MSSKQNNFYYTSTDSNNKNIYHCLYDGSYKIVQKTSLVFKTTKNYKMNNNYMATDEDLFKFRDDLHEHNDEIKQFFFKNKGKKIFKIDVFNNNYVNEAVYNNVIINTDQNIINTFDDIDFNELLLFKNCLTCGLMTVNTDILETPIQSYGYDFAKYYYNIMRKIRIPISKPEYTVIDSIDFNNLQFGYYRCKVLCKNPLFGNIFLFNINHHYSHNTLKTLYKYKDKFGIRFKLLPVDEEYNYNFAVYKKTIELKVLFKNWFDIIDKLLKQCKKSNWLVKTYVSQAWGMLSSYNKIYVDDDEAENYDFDQLTNISSNQYEYYNYKYSNGKYCLIDSNNPFKYKGLGRIKNFLTEYARMYMFNMISELNIEDKVIRLQTDSLCLTEEVDFVALGLKYYPIPELKTTGLLKFYNVNCYMHVCEHCNCEYKFNKNVIHECDE